MAIKGGLFEKYGTKIREEEAGLIPEDLPAHKMRHVAAMEPLSGGVDLISRPFKRDHY